MNEFLPQVAGSSVASRDIGPSYIICYMNIYVTCPFKYQSEHIERTILSIPTLPTIFGKFNCVMLFWVVRASNNKLLAL